jgi:hypothetical protein
MILVVLVLPLLLLASCATSPEPAKTPSEPTEQPPESAGWPKITYDISPSYEISSLEEASELAGWDAPAPVPVYLPEGCEIREVLAKGRRVYIVISDEEIEWSGEEFRAVMVIQVFWTSQTLPGLKLVPTLQDRGDHYDLWWQWPSPPSYELVLSASKDIPKEELFKVRDGMRY